MLQTTSGLTTQQVKIDLKKLQRYLQAAQSINIRLLSNRASISNDSFDFLFMLEQDLRKCNDSLTRALDAEGIRTNKR